MKSVRLAVLEFKRFRGAARIVVPIGLMFIPLLYGALYLWSNWDPYGETDKIPVAVVVDDQPAVVGDQMVDAGQQFTEQLRANPQFDWHFVDSSDAHDGLEHGRYYFTIHVPKDFTKNLVSVADLSPQRAQMMITMNDANNYVVGVVAHAARSELQSQVNTAAHTTYARTVYGDLGQVKKQLNLAAEGSHALVNGTVLTQQGSTALGDGIGSLQTAGRSLTSGATDLANATAGVSRFVNGLTTGAAGALPDAAGTLVNATDAGAQGLSLVSDGTGLLRSQTAAASAMIEQLARAHPELASDPVVAQLRAAARGGAQTADSVARTASNASGAATRAHTGAQRLQSDVTSLSGSLRQGQGTTDAVVAATREISTSAAAVTNGLGALQSGATTLHTGADQLHSGATQLSQVVDGAQRKIPDPSPQEAARAANVLGSPVSISEKNLHPADIYGRGLAPFFFAIALWVMGLMAYLFFQPVNVRGLVGTIRSWRLAVAGWLPVAVLGAAGGVILYAVIEVGLGLHARQGATTCALLIVGAAAFVAIDQFLRYAFGVVGAALSLALLIIQLTACGGLYPVETTPAPFQAIHPLIPMTYLVDGLRVTISGGLGSNLLRDFLVLAGYLVAFLVLTTVVIARRRGWTVNRLHPALEL